MSRPQESAKNTANDLPKKQAGEALKELDQLLKAKTLGFRELHKAIVYTEREKEDIAGAINTARKIYEVEMDRFFLNTQTLRALIATFCDTINKALTIILLAHNRARLSARRF